MVAKYWIESIARLPVEVEIASEFRYREPAMPKGGAAISVSQSGETADTLAALRYAKEQGQKIIAIVNAGELDRPRGRRRAADLGRPRDRRRLDQGLHHAARRPRCRRHRAGAGARRISHEREAELVGLLTEMPRAPARC